MMSGAALYQMSSWLHMTMSAEMAAARGEERLTRRMAVKRRREIGQRQRWPTEGAGAGAG